MIGIVMVVEVTVNFRLDSVFFEKFISKLACWYCNRVQQRERWKLDKNLTQMDHTSIVSLKNLRPTD